MLRDLLRFNREAVELLESPEPGPSLGDYLLESGYGEDFTQRYLLPMGAAIWSAPPTAIGDFPARGFVEFFRNHGLLSVLDRPQWRVIEGGSREYVKALIEPFRRRVHSNCPVRAVERHGDCVLVRTDRGDHRFDQAVMACHSDQALGLIARPTTAERDILGSIPYQRNVALLHTDIRVLPRRRLAWAAWNYHVPVAPREAVAVTYNMNILQGLSVPETLCLTLNYPERIDPSRVLRTVSYEHPVYTAQSVRARGRRHEINGTDRLWFCGAYWGCGFHEDGWASGVHVAEALSNGLRQAA